MALGVLEDKVLEHVPGTVYVYADAIRTTEQSARDSHLKRDKTNQIILVPQPSDDPNDPLNWPLWRRDLILGILSFVSVLSATTSPLLAADTTTLAFYFKKTFQASALLTGYHLCGVGVAGWLFVASARVWGKRHLFLLGSILMIASSAWGGATYKHGGYKSLIWARVFQGVALAPFEALVNATVGDLYFVHERGKRMALTNVALFGGAFLTPVIVGKLTSSLGWWWTFYFIAIFMAAAFPLVFFFVPETAYRRADYLNTDIEGETTPPASPADHGSHGDYPTSASSDRILNEKFTNSETGPVAPVPTRASFAKTLLPFNGRKTDESFFKLLLRPLPLFFHLGILWAALIQGVIIGWTVLIGAIIAAIFLGPPLFFDEVKTGYMYTGAFLGSMIGLVLAGVLSDWINNFMIRRNKGKYEPEFRILLMIPMMIFTTAGLYGFGITSANIRKYGWFVPEVFLTFVIIGMVLGAVASALYIVDAHRQLAVEAFTCLLIFKNMFAFVLTYYAYDWVIYGIRKLFIIIASVEVVICLLSIPMYVLGKRNRSFFHRHDILEMLHLR